MSKFFKRLLNIFTVLSSMYLLGFIYALIIDRELDWSLIGILCGSLVLIGGLNYLTHGNFTLWNSDTK